MLELGSPAPNFALPDLDGNLVCIDDLWQKSLLLVAFICPHCPYVRHIGKEFARVASDYADRGLATVAIMSNDVDAYPQDNVDGMRAEAEQDGYDFPYLYDETQSVARAYRAACTPDFFLFDQNRNLIYRGQFDSSRPRNDTPVTGSDLRAAIEAGLAGEPVPAEQLASIGCNIKWKPGNEPDYFG